MDVKDLLLKNLKGLESLEKYGVILLSKHIISAIEESSIQEDKKRRLLEITNILIVDTKRHASDVRNMMEIIRSKE